jgi:hypothetical protein
MVAYTKSNLKIAEFYYRPPASEGGLDIARCFYQAERIDGAVQSEFHTLQVDLRPEPEQLLAAMKKNNRYSIRWAARENIVTESSSNPGEAWMRDFFAFYDEFAKGKGLPPANRERLGAMRAAGMLDLSRALDAEGNPIVWHCALRTPAAVRLMHSCSLHREANPQFTGHANCYLHWMDFLRFREEGFPVFDFGGWYAGQDDAPKLRINAFKESFGGAVVKLYNVDRGVTVRGSIAVRARHLLESWREKQSQARQ